MTSRIEVIELLEKRVKSRFSHNTIMLKPPSESSQLLERLKYLLMVNKDCKVKSDIQKKWNKNVDLLISNKQIQHFIEDLSKLSNNNNKLNMIIVSI